MREIVSPYESASTCGTSGIGEPVEGIGCTGADGCGACRGCGTASGSETGFTPLKGSGAGAVCITGLMSILRGGTSLIDCSISFMIFDII
jgi:hypothetical protein